nr:MAG TPA: hypothetical protein [Caudoviricetes sp.]DAK56000.1 MAG TPA: hypothetical protein [Caudoviricetes sp.]
MCINIFSQCILYLSFLNVLRELPLYYNNMKYIYNIT